MSLTIRNSRLQGISTPDLISHTSFSKHLNFFHCAFWNSWSILSKIYHIFNLFSERFLHLLALQRTWLSSEDASSPAVFSSWGSFFYHSLCIYRPGIGVDVIRVAVFAPFFFFSPALDHSSSLLPQLDSNVIKWYYQLTLIVGIMSLRLCHS